MNESEFKKWMDELEAYCQASIGISIHDLPDMMFRDSADNGISVEEFFEEDVTQILVDEYGMNPEDV